MIGSTFPRATDKVADRPCVAAVAQSDARPLVARVHRWIRTRNRAQGSVFSGGAWAAVPLSLDSRRKPAGRPEVPTQEEGRMENLNLLKSAVTIFSRIITSASRAQAQARADLVDELQAICSECESAYSIVLERLRPVKDAYRDPARLEQELRDLAADRRTRDIFKADHLCGQVDHLLSKLQSNLAALKYSVDVRTLDRLKERLKEIGNYDAALYRDYDEFARDLDRLSHEIGTAPSVEDRTRLMAYSRSYIDDFEKELWDTIDAMRRAKDRVLRD
jgi:hypothetical protein